MDTFELYFDVPEAHFKVWGEEQWIENGDFCGKKMILYSGFKSSLHFHLKKYEVFYIESGIMHVVLVKDGERSERDVAPGTLVRIPPGLVHQFWTPDKAVVFFEFSSHHEDEDTYRIEKSSKMAGGNHGK